MSTKLAKPRKGGVAVGGNSGARCNGSKLNKREINNVEVDISEVKNDEVGKKSQTTSKSKNLSKSQKTVGSDYFTLRTRLAFTKLRQTFVKAPIFHHFDLERYICVETDASGNLIIEILSQLISDNLG